MFFVAFRTCIKREVRYKFDENLVTQFVEWVYLVISKRYFHFIIRFCYSKEFLHDGNRLSYKALLYLLSKMPAINCSFYFKLKL